MRALPLLEEKRGALEKCVFCPKLCRSACPVSNAEPRETLTPWGKMSGAWLMAHGDVPANGSHSAPAWACTGCFACQETCEHSNPVAAVLFDARDAVTRRGAAPLEATRSLARFDVHLERTRRAAQRVVANRSTVRNSHIALLVGCAYLRGAKREAADAVAAVDGLLGKPARVVEGCCGLPLRLAGDRLAFERHAARFAKSFDDDERILVVDPGCAVALKRLYRTEFGLDVGTRVEVFVEVVAREIERLVPNGFPPETAVRWHDPCQLGRGLGIYEAPRKVLERILRRPPEELDDAREVSRCSGAGGLLPTTMPKLARDIAKERLAAHARAGGGRVVTACASSLIHLRRRANGVRVDDLASWIAAAVDRR
ncbi:MAG: (Fe-S)-binding protein [Polyangiaceae bacterium]|jgi:Fe-S oxidoreductase